MGSPGSKVSAATSVPPAAKRYMARVQPKKAPASCAGWGMEAANGAGSTPITSVVRARAWKRRCRLAWLIGSPGSISSTRRSAVAAPSRVRSAGRSAARSRGTSAPVSASGSIWRDRWQKVRVAFRAVLGPSSGASRASISLLTVSPAMRGSNLAHPGRPPVLPVPAAWPQRTLMEPTRATRKSSAS